jgi:hypothetical protein
MPSVDVILDRKLLFTYPINLRSLNGPAPAKRDYIASAKQCALEDGLVKPEDMDKAVFRVRS